MTGQSEDGIAVVQRVAAAPVEPEVRKPAIPSVSIAQSIGWLVAVCVFLALLAGMTMALRGHLSERELLTASQDEVRARLEQGLPVTASASTYEILGEYAQVLAPDNVHYAYAAAKRAVEEDFHRPFVWARLAELAVRRTGKVNETALYALGMSMDQCALCSQDLVRWRLKFVLSNWESVPEELRVRAFQHADMLRWSGDNDEFLAEMRIKSEALGIDYIRYRDAVETPVPMTLSLVPNSLSGPK